MSKQVKKEEILKACDYSFGTPVALIAYRDGDIIYDRKIGGLRLKRKYGKFTREPIVLWKVAEKKIK